MILKDGDIYEQNNSKLRFILKQETPVTWRLSLIGISSNIDYPVYPEKYMKDLLEKNFRKVEENE